jgi:hypothetical protein
VTRRTHLRTRVGSSEKHAWGLAGQRGSLAGIAKAAEALDAGLDGTFLAKMGLGDGCNGSNENSLSENFERGR